MFNIIPKKLSPSVLLTTAFLLVASIGVNAQGNSQGASGQPFEALQQQIDALQSQIDLLTAIIDQGPIEIDVDCTAGDTVNGAIASVGDAANPLIINISGTCFETVVLLRSNVTLRGESVADGIDGLFGVLASRGANHINVESMTLSGTNAGLACFNGASVAATNVNIVDSGTGVSAFNGGNCQITDSTIDNSFNGVTASTNSNAWLRGVDITNSSTGINAFTNSSINVNSSPSDGSFSTISGSNRGIEIFVNGSVHAVRAIIENNNSGINILAGGSLFVDASAIVHIQNNANFGIRVDNLANTILSNGASIADNGGWGIECNGAHALLSITPPTYSNNALGDVHPNCGINP